MPCLALAASLSLLPLPCLSSLVSPRSLPLTRFPLLASCRWTGRDCGCSRLSMSLDWWNMAVAMQMMIASNDVCIGLTLLERNREELFSRITTGLPFCSGGFSATRFPSLLFPPFLPFLPLLEPSRSGSCPTPACQIPPPAHEATGRQQLGPSGPSGHICLTGQHQMCQANVITKPLSPGEIKRLAINQFQQPGTIFFPFLAWYHFLDVFLCSATRDDM